MACIFFWIVFELVKKEAIFLLFGKKIVTFMRF